MKEEKKQTRVKADSPHRIVNKHEDDERKKARAETKCGRGSRCSGEDTGKDT